MFESIDQLKDSLDKHFPNWELMGSLIEVGENTATTRLDPQAMHLRPGGTVSGPAMFGMADVCMYLAILWRLGPTAANAVTADMHSRFLRRPPGNAILTCRARLIRVGRTLIVAEAITQAEGDDEPLALFTGSYSNPTGQR